MKLRAPTLSSLPHTLLVPPTSSPETRRSLIRLLSRLSTASLISLALSWLEPSNLSSCGQPYLATDPAIQEADADEDYAFEPADSIEELRELWGAMRQQDGQTQQQKMKKRDIIDRILEGDWRKGLSLKQIAMADCMVIEERRGNCGGMRWTALRVVEQRFGGKENIGVEDDDDQERLSDTEKQKKRLKSLFPTVKTGTFLAALQREIAPLVKAHFYVHRLENNSANSTTTTHTAASGLTLIRLFVSDTPYATNVSRSAHRSFTDSSRTVFIAFPDSGSSPFIYISVSGTSQSKKATTQTSTAATTDTTSLKRIVLAAIPKALSRPQYRAALEPTNLTTRSLSAMTALRGAGRGVAANGAFGVFAAGQVEGGPLDVDLERGGQKRGLRRTDGARTGEEDDGDSDADEDESARRMTKKRRLEARIRFGITSDLDTTPTTTTATSVDPAATTAGTTPPQPLLRCDGNAPLDRFQVRLEEDLVVGSSSSSSSPRPSSPTPEDPTAASEANKAPLKLTFQGSHVFAGMRRLAELGLLDPKHMPSWMTGEDGVSSGIVRGGVMVRGGRGAGF